MPALGDGHAHESRRESVVLGGSGTGGSGGKRLGWGRGR